MYLKQTHCKFVFILPIRDIFVDSFYFHRIRRTICHRGRLVLKSYVDLKTKECEQIEIRMKRICI